MELMKVAITPKVAKQMLKSGWMFDWAISAGAISEKIGYFLEKQLQGLIEFERVPSSKFNYVYLIEVAPWNVGQVQKINNVAGVLFAYVARDSLEAGFDGFVAFESKTILVNHYIKKYGAKIIRGNQLMFDGKASKKLIKEFFEENHDEI